MSTLKPQLYQPILEQGSRVIQSYQRQKPVSAALEGDRDTKNRPMSTYNQSRQM